MNGADDLEKNFKKIQIEVDSVVGRIVTVTVDLSNATTDEVAQVTWMNREQIKELFERGDVGILLYGSG